jgi:hypothetical protein
MRKVIYISVAFLLAVCADDITIDRKINFKKKIYAHKCTPAKKNHLMPGEDDYITVWIHGINLFRANAYNIGLWPASTFVENESLFRIGKDLVESDPTRFSSDKTLVYSWSGMFDYTDCYRAAEDLYNNLKRLVNDYEVQNHRKPKIRIITFSYGGNIALSLPKIKDQRNKLIIDELILLAWPVQHNVVSGAKDPMFKKIFNLYSNLDCVQIIDPQGFICRNFGNVPLFSGRRIKRSDNVLQASIHLNGMGCGHFGMNSRRFVSLFPYILDELNNWFSFAREHNLGMKKTRYTLSIYTDKHKAHKIRPD